MAILESIGNGFRAAGDFVKALVWDNPIAKGVRFGLSAAIGIPCALAALAVTVPTIAAFRIATSASGRVLKFVGGERVKQFNQFLLGATQSLQNGIKGFLLGFCFYAPRTILSGLQKSSEKLSSSLGSGRTEDDDPHAPAITAAYNKGDIQSYTSQSIADPESYQEASVSKEEEMEFEAWKKQQEEIANYQEWVAAVSGATAPELRASPALQLKAAEANRDKIAKWREEQGLPPTKTPLPVSVSTQSQSLGPILIS